MRLISRHSSLGVHIRAPFIFMQLPLAALPSLQSLGQAFATVCFYNIIEAPEALFRVDPYLLMDTANAPYCDAAGQSTLSPGQGRHPS